MNPEDKKEVSAQDKREVRADARDVRADARDVRSDAKEINIKDQGLRADVREDTVAKREVDVVGSIRLLKWLVVIIIILTIGSIGRSYVNQNATDKATDAATRVEAATSRVEIATLEARNASLDTLAELRAIIASFESRNEGQPEVNNQIVVDAFAAIARIEGFLCGGPCPDE